MVILGVPPCGPHCLTRELTSTQTLGSLLPQQQGQEPSAQEDTRPRPLARRQESRTGGVIIGEHMQYTLQGRFGSTDRIVPRLPSRSGLDNARRSPLAEKEHRWHLLAEDRTWEGVGTRTCRCYLKTHPGFKPED